MKPQIHESVWVAPGVQMYGSITIAENCSVWPNVVMRAECAAVSIGRMSNIQDFVMIHVGYDNPTSIGEFCSITHHATVHGATVEDHCLIGINATIMDGAVVGKGSIVAGGAFITENSVFEPGSIIAGVPAKTIKSLDSSRANRINAWLYHRNAEAYKRGDHRTWTGQDYERWLSETTRRVQSDEDLK